MLNYGFEKIKDSYDEVAFEYWNNPQNEDVWVDSNNKLQIENTKNLDEVVMILYKLIKANLIIDEEELKDGLVDKESE